MPGIKDLTIPGIKEIIPKRNKTGFVVIVSNGLKGKPYPITEITGYNEGYTLRYKNSDDKLDIVYVGRDFRFLEINGKHYLGKRLGNNSGCEIVGPSSDPDCPGEDLSSLIRTDVLAIGYRTLTESKVPRKWVIIIIIIAIIAIAVIYFITKSRGGPY